MSKTVKEEEKSLTQLASFRFALFTPILISSLISCVIVYKGNLVFDFSYSGFNYALEVFRVPLGVLALAIPFITLIGANHRSVQTAAQITSTYIQIDASELRIKHDRYLAAKAKFSDLAKDAAIARNVITHAEIGVLWNTIYPDSDETFELNFSERFTDWLENLEAFRSDIKVVKTCSVKEVTKFLDKMIITLEGFYKLAKPNAKISKQRKVSDIVDDFKSVIRFVDSWIKVQKANVSDLSYIGDDLEEILKARLASYSLWDLGVNLHLNLTQVLHLKLTHPNKPDYGLVKLNFLSFSSFSLFR